MSGEPGRCTICGASGEPPLGHGRYWANGRLEICPLFFQWTQPAGSKKFGDEQPRHEEPDPTPPPRTYVYGGIGAGVGLAVGVAVAGPAHVSVAIAGTVGLVGIVLAFILWVTD